MAGCSSNTSVAPTGVSNQANAYKESQGFGPAPQGHGRQASSSIAPVPKRHHTLEQDYDSRRDWPIAVSPDAVLWTELTRRWFGSDEGQSRKSVRPSGVLCVITYCTSGGS